MRKVVVSGMIGNGLEWYDYALYGQMAWLLSKLFFPEGDPTVKLIATYGIFAAGFVIRPLGGILFGWIGDKWGRKKAMIIAVLMMAIPTGCIGLLPTYETIGIAAPVLLTVIRLLQGLSLGGEFTGSITYIIEHAPQDKRARAGSASLISLNLGFLLGLLVTQGIMAVLGTEAFEAWGWRIPFLIGIAIGFIGFYIRTHCAESPVYEQAKTEGHLSQTPVRCAVKKHPWQMLQGFAMYMTVTMPFYLTAIYFISFSQKQLGLSMHDALTMNAWNMVAMLAAYLPSALLADRIGRKKVMMAGAIMMALCVYPLFLNFTPGASLLAIGLTQAAFAFILGFYIGPIPAVLVELFPTSVRYTGMAIAYNLSAAVFGGTAPMVCEWLIRATESPASIAWYVMFVNAASLVALWFYKDRWKERLA
jgi:MFS transporter, MHS family, proline/betaine transporter